ncbi:hypothetical protein L3C95_12385 [Chitinophaga filiformis]|uniref:hypothetical protein n=1 Tax=Chitinophaga filiformis TaxID=104663 RepID=UPI001F23A3A0|nr:hypothetical protein [Chitinophaga filiformis]MCF6403680.1 hypothetical protein [Chitinophaga filiformis]
MIYNFLPYIFGLTSFLCGLYLFLRSFGLWKPRHKTEEQRVRYVNPLEKYRTFWKVCSVILILNGSYDLIMRNPDRYRIGNAESKAEWALEDRAILIKNCMRDAGPTATNYPQIASEYCACSIDRIMTTMTKDQYVKSLSKPQEDQMKELLPIFQSCLDKLKQRIDSEDKQTK